MMDKILDRSSRRSLAVLWEWKNEWSRRIDCSICNHVPK